MNTTKPVTTKQYIDAAKEVIQRLIDKAKGIYGVELPMPTIDIFSLKGKTGGLAYAQKNLIKLNFTLYRENYEDYINQIIPHEFAHLIARKLYHGIKPHGPEWQSVMIKLGYKPDRCHNFDVTTVLTTRGGHKYVCNCQEHILSTTLHNRINMGRPYHCRKCKGKLKLKSLA